METKTFRILLVDDNHDARSALALLLDTRLGASIVGEAATMETLLAAPLLILSTLIGVVVIAQTVSQTLAGFVFPIGVYIGMIGSWVVTGAFAVGLTIAYFRKIQG